MCTNCARDQTRRTEFEIELINLYSEFVCKLLLVLTVYILPLLLYLKSFLVCCFREFRAARCKKELQQCWGCCQNIADMIMGKNMNNDLVRVTSSTTETRNQIIIGRRNFVANCNQRRIIYSMDGTYFVSKMAKFKYLLLGKGVWC